MVHQRASRVAVDGKLPVNKSFADTFGHARRLAFAAAAFFVTSTALAHAQASGPYAGMAGNWSGGGTVTLDDGSRERIRCRASYQVAGPNMTMTLTCASDAYKFELQSAVTHSSDGAISGTWSEVTRGAVGTISGTSKGHQINLRASSPVFSALLAVSTQSNQQSISIQSPGSEISAVSINLSRGAK